MENKNNNNNFVDQDKDSLDRKGFDQLLKVATDSNRKPNPFLKELKKKCLTNDKRYISELSKLSKIIENDDSILITGETGVGKSFLAKIIHEMSKRQGKFFSINCGSLTKDQLYQKLFGWEKGAFTGADKNYTGIVKEANNGTILFDEIDRTTQEVRDALVTFIQDKEFDILGGEKKQIAKARFLFGTNKNLTKLVKKKKFEKDFLNRINKNNINIPPLRERRNDIKLLVDYIVNKLNNKNKLNIKIAEGAYYPIQKLDLKNNIRDLEKYINSLYYDLKQDDRDIATIHDSSASIYIADQNEKKKNKTSNDKLIKFESLLLDFLNKYDYSQGSFMDKVLGPILAKIYLKDYKPEMNLTEKKMDAKKIIGVSGEKFSSSTLEKKYYSQYDNVKKALCLK